jgi:hypothetical protein
MKYQVTKRFKKDLDKINDQKILAKINDPAASSGVL